MEAQSRRRLFWSAVLTVALAAPVIGTVKTPTVELAAQGMGPVLPLPAGLGELPFLGDALRDPDLMSRKPEDQIAATQLASEIQEYRGDIAKGGERAESLNLEAYRSYAALAYYFEDVAAGRLEGTVGGSLRSVRGMLVDHATAFARMTRDQSAKNRALYHVYATQYLNGQNRGRAVAELSKLAPKLPASLKNRAQMIVALNDLDNGNAKARRDAGNKLAQIARTLPNPGAIAARLGAARAFAGVSRKGTSVDATHAAYRSQLANVRVPSSPRDREAFLGYAVGVWRAAEGRSIDWRRAPVRTTNIAGSITARAVEERAALAAWQAGQHADAMRRYDMIARAMTGSPQRAMIDLRLLDMRRMDYVKTKQPQGYERALVAMGQSYLDTSILGEGNEAKAKAMEHGIAKRHGELVHGELARVSAKSIARQERRRAIALAERFVGTIQDGREIEGIKGKVAGLHALSGDHRDAVAIYKELVESGTPSERPRYMKLAIASQSSLAKWTIDAPWQGFGAGSASDREELLSLYRKLDETNGKQRDWFVAAQVGLLEVALGRTEQAFNLWTDMLKASAQGTHAAHASGMMLTAYQKTGDWSSMESLARVTLKARLQPMHRGKPVDATACLALALLEGGRDAMEQSQFAVAVTKLREFVKNHSAAKRHDEGFYLLAQAYRGNSQHKESITTLLAFVDRYPTSKFARDALLAGGDWSAPMAYEENAMFFWARFVSRFGKDAEAPRVRELLTELYLGRSLYAEALGMLHEQAAQGAVEQRAVAMAKILEIEDREGSRARATAMAQKIIAFGSAGADHKASAIAYLGRRAAEAGRFAELPRFESQLASLGDAPAVQEATGEVRYLRAAAFGRSAIKQYFNLELTDPTRTLTERYDAFKSARSLYVAVCDAGQSSFCAPAMHSLARLAEEFSNSIDELQIQDTLAKSVVDRFNALKRTCHNDAVATSAKSDERAVATVQQGYSDPNATQAVLWQNSADWNFDRVTGETGNGFVQWSNAAAAE